MPSHLSEGCGRGPGQRGPQNRRESAVERTLRADSGKPAGPTVLEDSGVDRQRQGKVVKETRQAKNAR